MYYFTYQIHYIKHTCSKSKSMNCQEILPGLKHGLINLNINRIKHKFTKLYIT